MPANIRTVASPTGRVVVVALIGEHDLATAPAVRRALLEASALVVVVDLADTTFVDSTILGILVGAWKRSHAEGRELIAVRASGIVAKALAITALTGVLSGEPDAEALALL